MNLRHFSLVLICSLCLSLSACVSTVVGTVVDTTIEVAKVPFKVGGAVVDVVTGDDDDED
ncbi:MAG: NF038104 family lipoprotein [Pseudomonadota bacterium]